MPSGAGLVAQARSAFGRRAGRRGAPTVERGGAKPRGRGLGQRNTKNQRNILRLINKNKLSKLQIKKILKRG